MTHTGQGEVAGAVLCWVGAAGGGTGFLLITSIRNGLWKTRPSNLRKAKVVVFYTSTLMFYNAIDSKQRNTHWAPAARNKSTVKTKSGISVAAFVGQYLESKSVQYYCLSWHIIQMFLKLKYTMNSRHVSSWMSLLR